MRKGHNRSCVVPHGTALLASQIRMTMMSLACEISAGTLGIVLSMRSLVELPGCRKRSHSEETNHKAQLLCYLSLTLPVPCLLSVIPF